MVNSRDVASEAGVSQATVSRVLSGNPRVTEKTRERVLRAMQQTGYHPNYAARAMRTQQSMTVGVVVANILNPFYPAVVAASSRELSRRGYRMILWEAEFGGEQIATEAIAQKQVDGVLFTTATPGSQPLATAVTSGAPTVLINRTIPELPCDQVDSDNEATAFDVASYFAARGHTRVGLVTADPYASTASLREKGFRRGAAAAGLKLPSILVKNGGFTHEGGHAALEAIMSGRGAPPTAIFCVNDLSAFGVIDAARSLGLVVPDDLWVVGYDDINMASWEAYSLTTAQQPIEAMVVQALSALLDRIADPDRPYRHYQFTSRMVVRGSTAESPFVGTTNRDRSQPPVLLREWTG